MSTGEHDGDHGGEHDDAPGPDLGAAAQASLDVPGLPAADAATQEPLDGTDYTELRFKGLRYTILEQTPAIGTRLRFELEVIVVGDGNDLMADGRVRHTVKVTPVTIVLIDEAAPDGSAAY